MKQKITLLTLVCLYSWTAFSQDFDRKPCDARVVSGGGDEATLVFRNTTKETLKLY